MAVIARHLRAVGLEGVEREDDVFRRHRLAVVPPGLGAQPVGGRAEILGIADGFRQQPVFRGDFIHRRRRQRVVDLIEARGDRSLHAGDRDIEVVERAQRDLPDRPAFRSVRIDIVEVLEIGRVLDVTEQRQPVPPCRAGRSRLRLRGIDQKASGRGLKQRGRCSKGSALENAASGNFQTINPVILPVVLPVYAAGQTPPINVPSDYVRFWIGYHPSRGRWDGQRAKLRVVQMAHFVAAIRRGGARRTPHAKTARVNLAVRT